MAMPNVLMIGPSPDAMGGMATVEKNILEAVRRRGDEAVFISTFEEGTKAKKLAVAAKAYMAFLRELRGCDLVHVHMASRGSYRRKKVFMDAAFRKKVPVVLHLHAGEFALWFERECNDSQRKEIRNTFHHCAGVIVLSEEWREYLLKEHVCNEDKLHVLHNAVPVPAQPYSPCSHQDVLFLGRLDANKSPDVLLRASRAMLKEHPEAKLLFGGDGYPERYEALACELGIAERCEFLGWIAGEEKERLFERAGVYCLPSKNEGMPMSVLEAMARGIPTIATPVGGVPQVIEDGVNGYLIPVDDEGRLTELLCMVLNNRGLRKEIGMAGRKTIIESFSIDRNVEELVRLYESVMHK